MATKSRIEISDLLLDENQPGSVKILKTGDKFQLCLTIGLLASNVVETESVTQQIKDRFTEAAVETELLLPDGEAHVILRKRGPDTKAPKLIVRFSAPIDTKIPGTGDRGLRLMNINQPDFEINTPEPVE